MLIPKPNKWLLIHLLFSSIFIYSCDSSNKSNSDHADFESLSTFDLTSKKVNFSEILTPYKIESKGEFLIVIEGKEAPSNHPIIHLLEAKNLNYKMGKGISGNGPNEITDAHLFHPGFNDSTFWVNSTMSKRMAEFSLYDSSKLSINEFRQPENMFSAIKILFATDSTFLCEMAADPNKFVEFDRRGKRIAGYGEWDEVPEYSNLTDFQQRGINTGWFKADPFEPLFVKAGVFRDRIEIFDYSDKTSKIIDGPRKEIPPFRIMGSGDNADAVYPPDTKYGYRDIGFGQKQIYALYGGYSFPEYRETSKVAETIYVISKEGKPKATLKLDRSLLALTVNESLGKIYGITTDENPGIAIFEIPAELLNKKP